MFVGNLCFHILSYTMALMSLIFIFPTISFFPFFLCWVGGGWWGFSLNEIRWMQRFLIVGLAANKMVEEYRRNVDLFARLVLKSLWLIWIGVLNFVLGVDGCQFITSCSSLPVPWQQVAQALLFVVYIIAYFYDCLNFVHNWANRQKIYVAFAVNCPKM